jgi:hypothetical protein
MGPKITMAILAILVMPKGAEEFLTPITDILDFFGCDRTYQKPYLQHHLLNSY